MLEELERIGKVEICKNDTSKFPDGAPIRCSHPYTN
jgi:hypothetical protein